MNNFVHLHVHSDYSMLDGANRIDKLLDKVEKCGMNAIAITDHGNMFAAIDFYKQATKRGIKPIIGSEVYVCDDMDVKKKTTKKLFHFVLLCKNMVGYKNLIKISSAGYTDGFYYKPRVDRKFLAKHSEGLIALSACMSGDIAYYAGQKDYKQAIEYAKLYKSIYGKDFYIEIQDHQIPGEKEAYDGAIKVAKQLDIPLVLTNDAHYLEREHAISHDMLICLQISKKFNDPNRMRFYNDEVYLKSPEEMAEIYPQYPEAYENTVKIAEKCNLELEFGKLYLPKFDIPDKFNSMNDYLWWLAHKGAEKRYGEITQEIEDRIKMEFDVITKMNYAGYFLIVMDFCSAARKMGVMTGCGRGSASGSIISYCLHITHIDPLEHGLLFERFLNPERVSMPDIDIDFCQARRGEIIDYVKDKYGEDCVSQIITFGKMKARSAIRDVARVMDISYTNADMIAKSIPFDMTIQEALDSEPALRAIISGDKRFEELIRHALVLEGINRHASVHAAGVVIAPDVLTNYVPLYVKKKTEEITTQYSMNHLEDIGLLKMDFLGLKTLTVIQQALDNIEHTTGKKIDAYDIPTNDASVLNMIARGETVGVFQLESSGMQELAQKMQPDSFNDIVAINALYRPGALQGGMVDDYIDGKHGRIEPDYFHPLLEPVLKETYGVILYQEQIMKIASVMAGFTLGQADILRRAIGKKKAELLEQQKTLFIKGSVANNVPKETAEKIFELINYFAGYGFNKSHSAAYATISMQTAWLKYYYPKEFMAALLSTETDDRDKIMAHMSECKKMGVKILVPDINESYSSFNVVPSGIRFGLSAVKNVGEKHVAEIVAARNKHGKFESLSDFCSKVNLSKINKRVIESLIRSGCLDSVEFSRYDMLKNMQRHMKRSRNVQKDIKKRQTNLFDMSADRTPQKKSLRCFDVTGKLKDEKELLGFYVSGHPLDVYEEEMSDICTHQISELDEIGSDSKVVIAGIITEIVKKLDRKNNDMAFIRIEDFSGDVEIVVFSDTYKKSHRLIKEDKPIVVCGFVSRGYSGKYGRTKLRAQIIRDLENYQYYTTKL